MLRLSWLGTYAQTEHDDRDDVVGRGPIDIVHDQSLWITEARLGLEIGLTRALSATIALPVRTVTTTIRYLDGAGAEVELVNDGIHHRNETVAGPGDPIVTGAATTHVGGWRLTGRVGLSVPLGETVEDPFALGDQGLRHQHVQLGTGTVNPVFGGEVARRFGRWQVGGFALTQQVVYANRQGYQAGDRYTGGVSALRRFERVIARAGLDVAAETAERWNGAVPTDDGNRGRFDLIVGAGASIPLGRLSLDLGVKVPVVTRVVGGQLAMPALVELGASWTFGGAAGARDAHGHAGHDHDEDGHDHGDDHDHDGHDHGDDHDHDGHDHAGGHDDDHDHDAGAAGIDTAGLDVVDLGPAGAAVALVPVPGKVTIFDFWAPWCQPCKTLEPALVELVRAHPERVALRRLDVVDWDSAAVATYLTPGGHDLPHVRIFDDEGQELLVRSSSPGKLEALIDEVRATVEAAVAPPPSASPPVAPPPSASPPVAPPPAAPPPAAAAPPPSPSPRPVVKRPRPKVYPITVTARGFEPRDVRVPAGKPVTLRFLRTEARTCATEVVMTVDGKRVVKDLPLDRPVTLTLTFARPGTVTYACAMDMIGGSIIVE